MLAGVKGVRSQLRDAVLAPELVLLGAILGVGVRYHVSTVPASEDHDSPHLVMGEVFLVNGNVSVSQFYDRVAGLAVVNCV